MNYLLKNHRLRHLAIYQNISQTTKLNGKLF